jgi:hypothetical protein
MAKKTAPKKTATAATKPKSLPKIAKAHLEKFSTGGDPGKKKK